jgi:hypothetical protein
MSQIGAAWYQKTIISALSVDNPTDFDVALITLLPWARRQYPWVFALPPCRAGLPRAARKRDFWYTFKHGYHRSRVRAKERIRQSWELITTRRSGYLSTDGPGSACILPVQMPFRRTDRVPDRRRPRAASGCWYRPTACKFAPTLRLVSIREHSLMRWQHSNSAAIAFLKYAGAASDPRRRAGPPCVA